LGAVYSAGMQSLLVLAADARLPCGAALLTVAEARDLLLARLPLRARLAAAGVCRAWRAALTDPTVWTRLVVEPCCCDAVLRAASARAFGRLELLDVSDAPRVTPDALVAVAAANAGALREMRGVGHLTSAEPWLHQAPLDFDAVRRLVEAAPALRVLDVSAQCATSAELRHLLRCEPPFGAVRARELLFKDYSENANIDDDVWPLLAAAPALTSFQLASGLPPAALDAFVDAAVARRLEAVTFCCCDLVSDSGAAALARLVRGGALVELELLQEERLFDDADLLAPLCDALREG
jgi:hypothetical protein